MKWFHSIQCSGSILFSGSIPFSAVVRLLSVQLVRFGPTAISSTAVLSTLGSSTNKYLDFKVRLASIHYFLVTLWKTLYGIHF